MISHRPSAVDVSDWATPESRPRLVVDERGVEWEIYDEATWSIELALDWEILPQTERPGLIFSSRRDRRRLWPCPANWKSLSNEELLGLLGRAKSLH